MRRLLAAGLALAISVGLAQAAGPGRCHRGGNGGPHAGQCTGLGNAGACPHAASDDTTRPVRQRARDSVTCPICDVGPRRQRLRSCDRQNCGADAADGLRGLGRSMHRVGRGGAPAR